MNEDEIEKAQEIILKYTKWVQEQGGQSRVSSVAIVNPEDGSVSHFGFAGTLPLLEINTNNLKRDISVTFSSSHIENDKLLHRLSTNL